MIIDSSAFISVMLKEDDGELFAKEIVNTLNPKMSVANYVEVGIKIDRLKNIQKTRSINSFIHRLKINLEPVTAEQAHIARAALRDFGKGTGHAAGLNYGDAFAYALAIAYDEPLLFKGNDFLQTDVKIAIAPVIS